MSLRPSAPRHCLGCSSVPPPQSPTRLPSPLPLDMPYGTRPCSPPSRHLLLGSQRACDTELWLGHRQTVRCLPSPPSLAPSTLRLRALRPPPAPPQAVSVTNLPSLTYLLARLFAYLLTAVRAHSAASLTYLLCRWC